MRPVSAPSEARGDSRSRPALAIGLGLVLVALFGVAGLLLGRQSGDASRAATSRAQAGDISLEVPSDWKRGGQAPRALIGTEATSATGRGGRLIAGTVAGAGPLFPGQAARRLIANAQASGTVRLGRLDAYRFDGERATLFLSPTSAGLVAVSCTGGRAFLPACQRAATTLRLDGDMRPVALAGLGGYAARADRVVDSLAATRRRDRSALRQARTRDSQKQIARQLAQADRVAARQLGRGVPDGVRPQAVVLRDALNRAAVAYGGLARAGTPAGYSTSSRRVRAAERQVDRALARL